jgi:hypothetical protein
MQGLVLPEALAGRLEETALQGIQTDDALLAGLARRIGVAQSVEELGDLADEAEAYAIEGEDEVWGLQAEHLMIAANARATRLALETGRPVYLAPYRTPERYTTFEPLLERLGDRRYAVGGQTRARREFSAQESVEALKRARSWYLQTREKEIEAAKARGRKVVAPMQADLLGALLRRDKALYHEDILIAWENGAHDMYGVDGGRWLYLLSVSAPVAARLAVLAHRARAGREAPPPGVEALRGQVATLLKLEGWQKAEDGYRWEGGFVAGNTVQIPPGGNTRLRLRLSLNKVTLRGKGVNVESALVPGLERSDYLAWVAFKAAGVMRRRARKKK